MIRQDGVQVQESPVIYENVGGVNIAVDKVYDVYVNGIYETSIVAMPAMMEEAALGYAITRGYPTRKARIIIAGDRINIELRGHNNTRTARNAAFPGECGQTIMEVQAGKENHAKIRWSVIMSIIRDFGDRTASRKHRVAAHTVAFYTIDGRPQVVIHDTSRHTAMLKLLGLKAKSAIKADNGIVASTGRASADIVYAASLAGAPVLVTLRGPLASGYKAARRLGVTLIANTRTRHGREFQALVNGYRLEE